MRDSKLIQQSNSRSEVELTFPSADAPIPKDNFGVTAEMMFRLSEERLPIVTSTEHYWETKLRNAARFRPFSL